MKQIKMYYARMNNMGDLLNEYIVPKVTGCDIKHVENVALFDVMGIGSCGGAIWGNKERTIVDRSKDKIKKCASVFNPKSCAIWGTGFIEDFAGRNIYLLRKNTQFIALRGARTKETIEKALGRSINPVLCDGGILCSELIEKRDVNKYEVGLIPHFMEIKLADEKGIIEQFSKMYPEGKIIDLRQDPLKVVQEISECQYVISSSLHGCIVADSFHIPNIRVRFSGIPGTGYKFDDYYSGYGLEIPAVLVDTKEMLPTIQQIVSNYAILPDVVEEKKIEMKRVLNQFIEANL